MDINVNSSKKISLNFSLFSSVFKRYKDYLLPIFVIFMCFIIFFVVVLPQFQNYLSARKELEAENQKLDILKSNYNFLSSLDDNKNNADFKTLLFALPSNKDFTGIINALSAASSKTGVAIGDFSFSLGDLSKSTSQDVASKPSVKIEVNLAGNAQSIVNFVNELYKTAPVSEILSIKASGQSSSLVIIFYYKPYPPQNVSDSAPVVQVSSKNLNLIKQIYSWNNISGEDIFSSPISPISSISGNLSSSSASLNPSPF